MLSPLPLTRDLVLVGGGHTHALVLRRFAVAPLPGLRITLINPDPVAAYSGMLPGLVAGHYRPDEVEIDLFRLTRAAGARLVLGRAAGIDLDGGLVEVPGRAGIAYDVLSLDIGISSEMPALPGFARHAVPAKPLGAFAAAWEGFVASGGGRVAVIGAGIAGVELALAARHRLGPGAEVTLIEAGEPLTQVGSFARRKLLARLAADGVALHRGQAAAVHADAVELTNGSRIGADFVIGAAGTRPQEWLAATALVTEAGFVRVDRSLRAEGQGAVFAAGDCAHLGHAPRPKAGVYAVREAPVLHHNLTAALTGGTRFRTYEPQRDYLKLISTGAKSAVADRFGLPLAGALAWKWKDRIDRRFMGRFAGLPAMPASPLPALAALGLEAEMRGGKPLCGGCGAKVGPGDLKAALAALPAPRRDDVLTGPGDDAAVLAIGGARQVLTTDHLRAFTADPWLMARITAVHALGDVWAMGARPQAALAQVILPRLSPALQARSLAEILAAAREIFAPEGADIVGGHTSLGAELTLGFTVTGLCDGAPIGQSGARPGDALILTKPLGTGVILAAEMARAAPPAAVAAALASMAAPQGAAAAILAPLAHAMTDVTGFGLAGHLLGILEASSAGAEMELAALPVLPSALVLANSGHGSVLTPANRAAVAGRTGASDDPRAALLHDPQTSGGLLAAIPEAAADKVLDRLHKAGFTQAARIGTVTDGPVFLTLLPWGHPPSRTLSDARRSAILTHQKADAGPPQT